MLDFCGGLFKFLSKKYKKSMKKYQKYRKIETKNKKQVHKKNKARKKRLIQKIKIFFIYVVFLMFINKQIKKGENQLFIALTSFTHAVCSFNLVYSGRIIEK